MKDFGVAFGGGAARGFAHLGVIRFLEENNLKPVEVAGTSMGAIMGACLAIGMKASDIAVFSNSINYLSLIDMNLKTGLVKGNKIKLKLDELFGDQKIEDLDVKLKIVATDINKGEKYVFDKGKVSDAVRASISIPSIFSFYELEKGNFIDGGVLNNLPIELLEPKKILAVSVMRDIDREIKVTESRFSLDMKKSFLGVNYQVLQKTIDIMMKQNELASINTEGKDVFLLEPEMEYDYYEFHKLMDISKIGHDSIREREDEFQKWLLK